jgi:hypothetical protein
MRLRIYVVPTVKKNTDTIRFLHQIAEKMHRRSMIILFTDMFQSDSADDNALFSALQHLRHNKHKVVLFHVVDTKTELNLTLIILLESLSMWRLAKPFRFSDNEGGIWKTGALYFKKALSCAQNKIKYVQWMSVMILKVLLTYLVENKALGNQREKYFFLIANACLGRK